MRLIKDGDRIVIPGLRWLRVIIEGGDKNPIIQVYAHDGEYGSVVCTAHSIWHNGQSWRPER